MDMAHSEIRSHLNSALGDNAYLHDINGDDKSGHIIFSQNSQMKKAPYKIRTGDAGPKATIDHASSVPVSPRTVYDEGHAWLPQGVLLVEGASFCETPRLQEAATADYPIKLISPGRGTSGYYGADVLKKAAESRVFRAGTQMFWNHDTDSEESARPEGDLHRLAAVTTTDASWDEAGRDGPGLYARAKVFGDYADRVREKGPHIGLSIRAGGERDEAARAPDGKPRVITALKNAQSVDFVTRAGRDGKIFTESASADRKEDDMDKAEVQALLKEAIAPLQTQLTATEAENKRLRERLTMSEAPRRIREGLADIRLPDASKNKIIRRLAESALLPDDPKELNKLIESEALAEAQFLQELGYGQGVAAFGARLDPAKLQEAGEAGEKAHAENYDKALCEMADIFVGPKLVTGGKEAKEARKAARKAFREGRAA